jgi:hypothetical protein
MPQACVPHDDRMEGFARCFARAGEAPGAAYSATIVLAATFSTLTAANLNSGIMP